jgi:hypothetical chaperone protein
MSKFLYGIDFGTTNSALSIYDEEKSEIVTTLIIPSLIYFPQDLSLSGSLNYVVGEAAITVYLQDGMKGRFIKSVKQILSKSSFIETRIQNKRYNAAQLVSLILKDLKLRADEITGTDCRKAIIGRPVFFDDDDTKKDTLAQTRLNKAAELAGFESLRFQYEPIGAAFAYEKSLNEKQSVLVADIGGGTTDFTYLTLDPDKVGNKDRKNDLLASGGIYIGGDSFDSAFMWEKGTPYFGKNTLYEATPGKVLNVPKSLFANICSWDKMNFFNGMRIKKDIEEYYYYSRQDSKFKNLITLVDNNLGYSVFQAIEKAKITLSSTDLADFIYNNMEIEINEKVSLSEYNSIIKKDLDKISVYLDKFIEENGIQVAQLDSLFLTGGTSMVAAIRQLFREKFPNINQNSGDNFRSVAQGLALSGYLFED